MRYCFTTKYRFYELLNLWSSLYNAFKTHEPHTKKQKKNTPTTGFMLFYIHFRYMKS